LPLISTQSYWALSAPGFAHWHCMHCQYSFPTRRNSFVLSFLLPGLTSWMEELDTYFLRGRLPHAVHEMPWRCRWNDIHPSIAWSVVRLIDIDAHRGPLQAPEVSAPWNMASFPGPSFSQSSPGQATRGRRHEVFKCVSVSARY
jgi:hypothetical protein